MKVVLSGGWGYGNLGDDAILVSTINIIREIYGAECKVVVLTYDVYETKANLTNLVNLEYIYIVKNVHRIIVRNACSIRFNKFDSYEAKYLYRAKFWFRAVRLVKRVYYKLLARIRERFFSMRRSGFKYFESTPEIYGADLFVLAGGGYFNEGWLDKTDSVLLELEFFQGQGIPIFTVGQSIGPFSKDGKARTVYSLLRNVTKLSVRDRRSFDELTAEGIRATIIPDIVLSEKVSNYAKSNTLVIVVGSGGLDQNLEATLLEVAKMVEKDYGFKTKIIVSRRWADDCFAAYRLAEAFKSENVGLDLVIPRNFQELQDEIGVCRVMISQNLHGLILGWRASIPGISLNSSRKFESFMTQTGQQNRIIRKGDTREKIFKCVSEVVTESYDVGFESHVEIFTQGVKKNLTAFFSNHE
ncbi:polysaccharide pyruvyl transferase family protein [Leadbetterella byssophila]|uniref:polysaccharide pyruvyl transferase family protein n=1 Tax=Leadbetterella byssophila TaxID=316068 RepID=UPI0039A05527